MSVKNRLLLTGSPKSGKTTLCAALSDQPLSVSTVFENASIINAQQGVAPSDPIELDYGEIALDQDRVLEIYATPGQNRFRFMWKNLAKKCLGVIIVIDNRRPNPLADLDIYLDNFELIVPMDRTIVLVNFFDAPGSPHIMDYSDHLTERGFYIPVVRADPRNKHEALYVLSILLSSFS